MQIVVNIITSFFTIGLPYALVALGIFISYRQLDIADLTAEGSYVLGGAIVAAALVRGVDPIVAMLFTIIGGFMAGVMTGLLHTFLKIPSLLSGIISLTALVSINTLVLGFGSSSDFQVTLFIDTKVNTVFELLNVFDKRTYNIIMINIMIVMIVIGFLCWFFGTEFGMAIRATGVNQYMARAQSVNTNLTIILGLGLANALIAVGGSLSVQYSRTASTTSGAGCLVIGLASILLGEAIFGKKNIKIWIFATVCGALLYTLIIQIAIALNMNNYLLQLVSAIIFVLILVLSLVKNKRKRFINVNS